MSLRYTKLAFCAKLANTRNTAGTGLIEGNLKL